VNQTTGITVGRQRPDARVALASPGNDVASLYIHVPFCFHKCHYCDFYSFVDSRDRQADFVEALSVELGAISPASGPLKTIFVGGGTPSLLRPELWEGLLVTLGDRFDLSRLAEFTVECNPETVTPELASVLHNGGVTRASVGAQSFEPRHLKTLERWHDPANVERSLATLRDAGIARRSVDLIFGIPGQTLGEWETDLDTALGLLDGDGIEHISAYALTYEQGTAMTKKLELGRLDAIDEDVEVEMQLLTWSKLADRGFERYEVSNFARAGAECLHNMAYWRQEQWLAAGPSASGHARGYRWKNIPRLPDWMDSVRATGGWSSVVDLETPSAPRALAERIMTGLRLREGLDLTDLLERAESFGAGSRLRREIDRFADRGELEIGVDGRLRLADQGWLFADGIAASLMDALSSRP
jgi:oxygen-independent coproporphyrinogen-3 oxidase